LENVKKYEAYWKKNYGDVGTYTNKIDELYVQVLNMLSDFGFSAELYLIAKRSNCVEVEFDDSGAVFYFRDQCEIEYTDKIYVEYVINGKRHMARVQYW